MSVDINTAVHLRRVQRALRRPGVWGLVVCVSSAVLADAVDGDAGCAGTTATLQAILDATATAGGGWAPIPCGFHATAPLTLPSGVKVGAAHCVGGGGAAAAEPRRVTLGACASAGAPQQHIVAIGNGTGQAISGLEFDHTNLTDPSTRSSCAVTGGSGSTGFVLENSRFLNINTTSQGFSVQ